MRSIVTLSVALLVFVAALTYASASQLTVSAGTESAANVLHKCASQTLTATPTGTSSGGNYTAVQVSGIATACQGQSTRIELRNASGTLLASGTVTPGSATATFSTGSYSGTAVTAAVVKVNGWLFRPAWTPPSNDPAVNACAGYLMTTGAQLTGVTCTLTATNVGDWQFLHPSNGGPGRYRSVQMSVAFTPDGFNSPSGWVSYQDTTLWRYTLNLSVAPYASNMNLTNGFYLYNNGNNAALAPGEDCSNLASMTFQEAVAGSNPSSTFILSEKAIGWMAPSALLCPRP